MNAKSPHRVFTMGAFLLNSLRRPTLPHSYPCSTIGPERLNFRVRDGNGCDPLGIATEKLLALTRLLSFGPFGPLRPLGPKTIALKLICKLTAAR